MWDTVGNLPRRAGPRRRHLSESPKGEHSVNWFRRRGPRMISLPGIATDLTDGGGGTGEYRPLYKYLRDRFADRVVMTFREIEDIVGFSLPEPARWQREWWGGSAAVDHSAQANSWTLSGRTATVNLVGQIVVFERHSSQYTAPAKA